jgi:membrane-bound serine protease (ClpP class)
VPRVRALLSLAAISLVIVLGGAARAQEATTVVDVVKVKGLVDPALDDFVRGAIERDQRTGAMVVLQIDSLGGYGEQAVRLGRFIRGATVPVVAWVGPAGARAEGGALFMVYGSSLAAMAPGAGLGPARPFDLATAPSHEDPAQVARLGGELASIAPGSGATAAGARRLLSGPALPAGPALDAGAVAVVATSVCDLLDKLDGRSVTTGAGSAVLETGGCPGGSATVRFQGMGPVRRVLHAVGTPTAVYLLIVLGVWGIAFELTQPALGLAGIAGATFLAFAGYGLGVVPVRWAGFALLLAGMGLQGLDVVVRRLGLLTGVGTAAFVAGSLLTWRGVASAIDLPVWLVVVATVAGVLFFGFGMTVALRAKERVRSAQVGLVGLVGEVRSDLNPEGGVYVKGAIWRARSIDGPIRKGSRVRVKGVDGLILRVEPEADPGS